MASQALREELNCSLCLDIYTNPVMLSCGHSYCQECIGAVLDAQEASGGYLCPECRTAFPNRPALLRLRKLCNIVEHFMCKQEVHGDETVRCSYCIDFPAVAVKTCLLCEASLCEKHVKIHSTSAEHVLVEPMAAPKSRKCPIHMEPMKYYCLDDNTCICVSCCLVGEHRGHNVDLLEDACAKKRDVLTKALEKLASEKHKTDNRVLNLEKQARKVQERASGIKDNVTELIDDIIKQVRVIQETVLGEIMRHEKEVSMQISGLIQQLEIEKESMSIKMQDTEHVCNMTDPMSLLDGCKSLSVETADAHQKEAEEREDICPNLDEVFLSLVLQKRLQDFSFNVYDMEVNGEFNVPELTEILLDVHTAGDHIVLSEDCKKATKTDKSQPNRNTTVKHFQVLSTESFSSGSHYWEVDTSESMDWKVGVSYYESPNVFVFASDAWYLCKSDGGLCALHKDKLINIDPGTPVKRLGIYLDYESGRLSMYEVLDAIRHLHTFRSKFPGPLFAAFIVKNGCIRIISNTE
ncbi:E3 ubiquitin-protein ligase TRIM62-like [Discoglossus pictus]